MSVHEVLSRLPEPVSQLLAGRALDAEFLAPVLDWPAGHAVLLAGSFVNATQTDASDLDFLVLRESGDAVERLAHDRDLASVAVQSSTLADRILARIGGVEFDICILTRDRMTDLSKILQTCVGEDGTISSLPVLQYLEDKLLCRLYEGAVLQNEAAVRDWRRFLRVDHLPALLTAGQLSDALSLLEDAVTLPLPRDRGGLDNPFGGLVAARAAAERLLRAAVTSVGVVGWDLRHAALCRDRLVASGDNVPGALLALEDLLFPVGPSEARSVCRQARSVSRPDPGLPSGLHDYLRTIAGHLKAIIDSLDDRPEMRAARDYLHEFGTDRWAIDTDLIDLAWRSKDR
jgi:hypothetical protein